MKIAIPVWKGFVSNVFDFAGELVLIEVEGRKESGRRQISLGGQAMQQRVGELVRHNVDVLICGGISGPLSAMLSAADITVIPCVTGEVEEVLKAYYADQLSRPRFMQPGCGTGMRQRLCRGRRGQGRRGRCGRGPNRPAKRQGWEQP